MGVQRLESPPQDRRFYTSLKSGEGQMEESLRSSMGCVRDFRSSEFQFSRPLLPKEQPHQNLQNFGDSNAVASRSRVLYVDNSQISSFSKPGL
ncbi:glucose-6-phosphate 1-dehydrogenase 4, chloroplastic-like [Dorcoceras hygrometricum]|uniref:Glucose-6-phosphate 1-dehydrogenase 4, chloroplastic-like n=1 Tax=Dorcoceras hygrometricum TaxID=472368 RepID=A0A2Z7DA15_9LAMI|nr:glucose-6-phosphate 1-dehydrogenase 4, chloroplastic-like [Dorcoceras hygrometricum]